MSIESREAIVSTSTTPVETLVQELRSIMAGPESTHAYHRAGEIASTLIAMRSDELSTSVRAEVVQVFSILLTASTQPEPPQPTPQKVVPTTPPRQAKPRPTKAFPSPKPAAPIQPPTSVAVISTIQTSTLCSDISYSGPSLKNDATFYMHEHRCLVKPEFQEQFEGICERFEKGKIPRDFITMIRKRSLEAEVALFLLDWVVMNKIVKEEEACKYRREVLNAFCEGLTEEDMRTLDEEAKRREADLQKKEDDELESVGV